MQMHIQTIYRRYRSWILGVSSVWGGITGVVLLSFYMIPTPSRLHSTHSPLLLYNDGSVAHIFLSPDEKWRTQTHIENIDPQYITALLSIEDKRFYQHPGFDPISIWRALLQNITAGYVVSGASTITMQLVRIVEPRPRNYRSKLIEIWRAMQLEWLLSKEEILELYLCFIPFGKNIEGVEAASLAYFGYLPKYLEADQIALLIAVPQNPNARYPSPTNKDTLTVARNHIAELLHSNNTLPISAQQSIDSAVYEKPIINTLRDFPRDLPHLADQLVEYIPPNARITTTLDKHVQHKIQSLISKKQSSYASQNIHNVASVVLDHKQNSIIGLVGNFNYWDESHASQIPAYAVPRSTASTMKPFIYASAIDLGLATPARKMEDIPKSFHGYNPRNYGNVFHGLVSLEESLSQSYNIPFVQLIKEIGVDAFLDTALQLGIHSFVPHRSKLGLSIAVGIDSTLLELTHAYSTFANKGNIYPLHIFDKNGNNYHVDIEYLESKFFTHPQSSNTIFSPASTWLTEKALQQRDRVDFPGRLEHTKFVPFAWKTGTSFGFHDAWTVGWSDQYVVGVWLGNLDYRSSMHLIGSETAGIIFFDIMEQLQATSTPKPPPPDLVPYTVCSYSGLLPTSACPHLEHTFGKEDRVPSLLCENHHQIQIDTQTGLRVSPMCSSAETKTISVLTPSTEYAIWSKIPSQLPDIAPECTQEVRVKSRIAIRSPKPNQRIILFPDDRNQQIPLTANYIDNHAEIFWYIDGEFIGTSTTKKELWWTPSLGTHTIQISDGQTHFAEVTVTVDNFH